MTPQDYRVPGVTTLTFPVSSVNMAEQCLMITIVDDTLAEGDESFTVSLINPVGGGSILGTPSTASVVITDNGTVKTTYIRQFT